MLRIILVQVCAGLVLWSGALMTSTPSQAAARLCWSVMDSAQPGPDDEAMETLCVDGNLDASFGAPSGNFGDIARCGKLSSGTSGLFDVDLSACDGAPSHKIACKTMGAVESQCVLTWANGGDRPVTLVRASE